MLYHEDDDPMKRQLLWGDMTKWDRRFLRMDSSTLLGVSQAAEELEMPRLKNMVDQELLRSRTKCPFRRALRKLQGK